jgi:hypothetical protein
MALRILPSIIVITMLWLTKTALFCSSKVIIVFSSFLILSPIIDVSSFANSAVPFLNCIRTAPHRTPRILPQKKFIPKCFCWIQLKRNYICDKNITVIIIFQWPLLVFGVSSASIATPFWNENAFEISSRTKPMVLLEPR